VLRHLPAYELTRAQAGEIVRSIDDSLSREPRVPTHLQGPLKKACLAGRAEEARGFGREPPPHLADQRSSSVSATPWPKSQPPVGDSAPEAIAITAKS
jgi:hypothetical protein